MANLHFRDQNYAPKSGDQLGLNLSLLTTGVTVTFTRLKIDGRRTFR